MTVETARAALNMEARIVLVALAFSSLAACQGSWIPTLPLGPLKPYRIDIQQGNVVTQEMMAKVQPGMTRSQVRFALGTPLVADVFHPDRWDYVYQYQKAGVLAEQRRIVVIFKDDKLVRIEGDVVPANSLPGAAKSGKPEKPAAPAPAAPPVQESPTSGAPLETSAPWPK
jgi:outer membrane protein assembly factor BamE